MGTVTCCQQAGRHRDHPQLCLRHRCHRHHKARRHRLSRHRAHKIRSPHAHAHQNDGTSRPTPRTNTGTGRRHRQSSKRPAGRRRLRWRRSHTPIMLRGPRTCLGAARCLHGCDPAWLHVHPGRYSPAFPFASMHSKALRRGRRSKLAICKSERVAGPEAINSMGSHKAPVAIRESRGAPQ